MRKNNDNTIAISPLQRVQIQRPQLGTSFSETYKLTIKLNEGRNESPDVRLAWISQTVFAR
jgi:hypothetical protein